MLIDKAKHKARVLSFWAKHGLEATMEAFEVKGRTLYYWRRQLREGGGRLKALNEKSKTPRRRRRRTWPPQVLAQIRHLRTDHPNLGKEKLYLFLKRFCEREGLDCAKPRTIGRIIADAPGKMRSLPVKVRSNGQRVLRKKVAKARKPKGFKSTYPGHCGAFDTVERFIEGYRR